MVVVDSLDAQLGQYLTVGHLQKRDELLAVGCSRCRLGLYYRGDWMCERSARSQGTASRIHRVRVVDRSGTVRHRIGGFP